MFVAVPLSLTVELLVSTLSFDGVTLRIEEVLALGVSLGIVMLNDVVDTAVLTPPLLPTETLTVWLPLKHQIPVKPAVTVTHLAPAFSDIVVGETLRLISAGGFVL